jgi:hypothetical protein
MRRSVSARLAAVVFATFMVAAPAFAAPAGDDSPIGGIERTISRFVKNIVVQILDLYEIQPPH